ncbi:MAG: bacteriohemerythrin [Proteobacteria bacterium]|nr:bacteriohemerythrin [Pseudomonadota bacterium]
MPWYDWNESLNIGVKDMNDEHKVLIDLMNKLYDQYEKKESHAALLNTFESLAAYTQKHFADEEKYMDSISYPELRTHKLIHTQLLVQLDQHLSKFREANGTLASEVFDFLKMWLNAHIKGIDIKYGHYGSTFKKSA